jgi:hypothetical protein
MQKVLQHLVALQELDTRLDQIKEKLGDLPETVKTLEIQIENEKEQNSIRQTSIEENAASILDNNGKITELKGKIAKYKEQIYLVTTNREYDALTAEIEFNETAVKEAETQILQSEEDSERLKKAFEDSDKTVADMEKNLEDAKTSLIATQKETEIEQSELEAKREGLVKNVPRNYLSVYTRVRKARNGLAVVPLMRDACSGCHNRVIPQKRVDIYKKNQVITCDFCGRFLFAADENQEED